MFGDIRPMARAHALLIAAWAYPAPYEMYGMGGGEEAAGELMDGSTYAVLGEDGAPLGFFCFGAAARVPAGEAFGAYQDASLLDIGLGLRPDLCGKGLGPAFLQAGLAFGREAFRPAGFRLTVAAFNQRAVRVYEGAGFAQTGSFTRANENGGTAFLVMALRAAP